MTADEISLWSKTLLLKIHVITGWTLPEGLLQDIAIDQFQKKMVESYPDVNPDEVEYAFRNYGTKVKDWGKMLNLSLIEEVMIPYLADRHRVGHEVEERKDVPEQKIYTQKELDNLARKDTEAYYQRLRAGNVLKNEKTPDYVAPILIKDNLIKDETEVNSFLMNRLSAGIQNIYKKIENE